LPSPAISLVDESVKRDIYRAYACIDRANAFVAAVPSFDKNINPWAEAIDRAHRGVVEATPCIDLGLGGG